MPERYDPMTDPKVLAELAGPYDPEAHLRVQPLCLPTQPHLPMDCPADVHNPEATDKRPRPTTPTPPNPDLVLSAGIPAFAPDYDAADLQASIDLRGADDDRPVTEQRLTGQDRATLRWFAGKHTLQDWLDKAPEDRAGVSPHLAIAPHTPLRMGARQKAVQDAQTMIRHAPQLFISPVLS